MDGNTTAAGSHHFIGNRWVASSTSQTIDVIDPSDGKAFAKIARGNADDIDAAVLAARSALGEFFDGDWGRMTATERGRLLMKLSYAVGDHHDELARLESRTTGKPLKQGLADATALARYCEYYAGAADKLHGDTIPYQAGMTVLTLREPHGVTSHIVPWNYPMQIFGRSVGAALAAGNACVVKPAEDACLSVIRVAQLAADVGFPAGALNIVTGYGAEAGAALAQHRGVDHISFTGASGSEASLPGHTGARRKVAADRFCRRTPRRRVAGRGQCDRPERGPNVLGRQPPVDRTTDLR